MTTRAPGKTKAERKRDTERTSRHRALLGQRYLPAGAKPFPDDGIKMLPGIFLAVANLHEDVVHELLIRHGYLTLQQIEADDREGTTKRVDAAAKRFLTLIFKSNTLRVPPPPPATVGDENSNVCQASAAARARTALK